MWVDAKLLIERAGECASVLSGSVPRKSSKWKPGGKSNGFMSFIIAFDTGPLVDRFRWLRDRYAGSIIFLIPHSNHIGQQQKMQEANNSIRHAQSALHKFAEAIWPSPHHASNHAFVERKTATDGTNFHDETSVRRVWRNLRKKGSLTAKDHERWRQRGIKTKNDTPHSSLFTAPKKKILKKKIFFEQSKKKNVKIQSHCHNPVPLSQSSPTTQSHQQQSVSRWNFELNKKMVEKIFPL